VKDVKITIKDDNVILEIDDIEDYRFEVWTVENKTTGSMKIEIPQHVWADLIDDWNKQRSKK
jgi:hypothetical protein